MNFSYAGLILKTLAVSVYSAECWNAPRRFELGGPVGVPRGGGGGGGGEICLALL